MPVSTVLPRRILPNEKTMQGYDLDDTLAQVDFRAASNRSLADLFATAPVIYTPNDAFVVITGRPAKTALERAATSAWLAQHQPNFIEIYYVPKANTAAGSAANKAAVINRLGVTDFTDDNPNVLAELAKLTMARLWVMSASKRTAFVDRRSLAKTWAPTLP